MSSKKIQIRPLSYWRTISKQDDGVERWHISTGRQSYLTYDCLFVVTKLTEGWALQPYYVAKHPELADAMRATGIYETHFRLRSELVEAVETILAGMNNESPADPMARLDAILHGQTVV